MPKTGEVNTDVETWRQLRVSWSATPTLLSHLKTQIPTQISCQDNDDDIKIWSCVFNKWEHFSYFFSLTNSESQYQSETAASGSHLSKEILTALAQSSIHFAHPCRKQPDSKSSKSEEKTQDQFTCDEIFAQQQWKLDQLYLNINAEPQLKAPKQWKQN